MWEGPKRPCGFTYIVPLQDVRAIKMWAGLNGFDPRTLVVHGLAWTRLYESNYCYSIKVYAGWGTRKLDLLTIIKGRPGLVHA